jgi:hypothetical protein
MKIDILKAKMLLQKLFHYLEMILLVEVVDVTIKDNRFI